MRVNRISPNRPISPPTVNTVRRSTPHAAFSQAQRSWFSARTSLGAVIIDREKILGPGSELITADAWRAPDRSPYPQGGHFFLTTAPLTVGPWEKPPVKFEKHNGVVQPATPDFEFPYATLTQVRVPADSPFLIRGGDEAPYVPALPLLEQACQFQLPMFDRFPTKDGKRRLTIFFERWEQIHSATGPLAARPGDLLDIVARLVPEETTFIHHTTKDQYRVDACLDIRVTVVERDGQTCSIPLLCGKGIINGTTESREVTRNIFEVADADFQSALTAHLADAVQSQLSTDGEVVKAGRFGAGHPYIGFDTLSNSPDGVISVRHFNAAWPVFDYHFGGNVRLVPGIVLADLALQRLALEPFVGRQRMNQLDVTAFGNYHLRRIDSAKFHIPCLPGSLVYTKLVNPQVVEDGKRLVISADSAQVVLSRKPSEVFAGGRGRTSAEFTGLEIEMPIVEKSGRD